MEALLLVVEEASGEALAEGGAAVVFCDGDRDSIAVVLDDGDRDCTAVVLGDRDCETDGEGVGDVTVQTRTTRPDPPRTVVLAAGTPTPAM